MSGRSIGTALGFVVGLYFGNPSLGATLGGMIGGAVDPDKVQGAKIGELPVQRSLTGGVQPVVLGTSLVDQCLIMWAGKARVVKEKDQQGKGGGPVVVNEVLYQDYRIRVCRSSLADGSQVQGFPVIFEDGRLVYDTRPSPRISAADSAKWAQNVVFYYGGPDQEPDPTEEAEVGVGNASAHRQIASFVKVNQKMTDFGNRIPTYEVVVSKCGIDEDSAGFQTYLLITGGPKGSDSYVFASALATPTPSFIGLDPATGADLAGATPAYNAGTWVAAIQSSVRYSTDDRATWQTGTISATAAIDQLVGLDAGWLAVTHSEMDGPLHVGASPAAFTATTVSATFTDATDASSDANASNIVFTANGQYFISRAKAKRALYRSSVPGGPYTAIWDVNSEIAAGRDPNAAHIVGWYDLAFFEGEWYAIISWHFDSGFRRYKIIKSPSLTDWTTFTVLVDVGNGSGTKKPVQFCLGDDELVCYATDSCVWTSANGWASPIATGIGGIPDGGTGEESYYVNESPRIAYANGLFYLVDNADKLVTFNASTLTMSAPITLPITSTIGIVAGTHVIDPTYLPIPDADGHYIDPITGATDGPSPGESSLCGTTLAEVVRYICNRGQLTDAELYLDELEDVPVRGITLQSAGTCKDELDPIRQSHFFDPADFDSKLRFRMRGADAVDLTINPDDLVFTEDDEEQNRILGQEVDLSRKHMLNYLSLDLDYLRTAAPHEFITLDSSVVGTSDATVNEVFSHEEATRISAIQHELLRMGNEGYRKFGLPMEYLPLVGASLVTLNGRRGRIDGYSLDLNAIWFDPVPYDRARAYDANVVAPVLTPPTGPGTSIKGPTDSTLLNVPVLRDADDKPGIIWAPRGYPNTAWDGAILQVLRDGAWLEVDQATRACHTGTLLSELPANDGPIDEVHTLQIRLSGGMDSITFAQFLNEGNPLAIQYPDGKAEILQAQFATEISDGVYDCTRLIRGRLDTVNGAHLAGARVVFLNNDVRFVQVRKDDIGKTISYRAVSNGTDQAVAEVQTITLTTMESQREWQPYNVSATKDADCQWLIDWVQRPRLGTDANPIQSQWWVGDRIDFITGGVTKSRMTRERPFLYTAAMQIEDWGAVRCAGYAVNVAAVNEYTGSDGSGGTGGGTGAGDNPNYPATIIGSPSDGYVGEPIFDPLGPTSGSPFQAYGGMWDELFVGEIVANVTCQSQRPGEGVVFGVPLTAETRNAATELIPSGPLVVGGPFLITDSVTIAAKPTYGMMDESLLSLGSPLATPVTTPARVAKTVPASGFGGIASRAGFSSGFHWAEFVITGLAGGSIAIGVHAGSANSRRGLSGGVAGHYAYAVGANGTYMVTVDASTGAVEVFKLGVGSVATGTLGLTYSFDGKYRFAWNVINSAPGATVRCNQGNETPAITPPVGSSGVPNVDMIVPCGFDAAIATANNTRLKGELSLTDATPPLALTLNYAYAAFGKSTGKWRIGMACGTTGRIGFCKAGHTGLLGASGTADSIGFTDTRSPAGYVIETSFGGVFNRITIPPFAYYSNPIVRFALDADAGTLEIYVKVEVTTGDPTAVYELLATLTGVPAGTWLHATNGRAQLIPQIDGPATYDDWTLTL